MASQPNPLNDLLPELYPIIAAHLPLSSTPSTLLSLALVNHHIHQIVLPLLYSRLILKNETDALNVIQRLLDEPELGRTVREFHVLSNLSFPTRTGASTINIVTSLENLITTTSLPYIHTLGLHLLSGWYWYIADSDGNFRHVVELFGQLRSNFWINLKKNCPRLRELVLRGISENEEDPWITDSGLLEIQDITSFTLNTFGTNSFTQAGMEKLLKNVDRLSADLHTLDLAPGCDDWVSASPLLAMTFPKLRSLSLDLFGVENTTQAMLFWERHPALEVLKIVCWPDHTRWFSGDSIRPWRFLPNLKHLKTHFSEVRNLAPILSQLASLSIYGSVNAQIPYLLRSILPDGLPHLRSLEIWARGSGSPKDFNLEGGLWYETKNGKFCKAKSGQEYRDILGCIHSIVRGTPNLEEIRFLVYIKPESLAGISFEIAGFSKLRRFYYAGSDKPMKEDPEVFISNARTLAEACTGLTLIVNTSGVDLPYVAARISRTNSGEISSIDVGSGYGMQVGSEDEAFPE